MKINVEPRLKRISGVGKAQLFGSNYSMRLWLKPDRMAQYGLIPDDISAVLARQNIEAATGSFGANHPTANEYTMKYRGRLSGADEFGELVVKSLPGGNVLRLKEVADVELGDEYYNYSSQVNGHPAAMMMINQKAGSNASSTINEIHEVLHELDRDLPEGAEFVVLTDTNKFLYASIRSVIRTLLEAILLVIVVVYVFLQDIKSTLIPAISIFVSIIGTFAVMSMIGFSINLLTLFALVLAIGTVVDDAIVVVEAVQAKFDEGYQSAVLAADDAMKDVSSAILTSTIIFMAVFFPVAMMGGTSGAFYAQFGITMAVAVGISAINAFTLSPALCALLLKPYIDEHGNTKDNFAARFRKAFNAVFYRLSRRYVRGVMFILHRRWLMWSSIAVSFVLLVLLVNATKTGLIPEEDTGTVMVSMNTKPGTSMAQTVKVMERINSRLDSIGEIEYNGAVAGFSFSGSGPSQAMYFVTLKDWEQREGEGQSVNDVIGKIYAATSDIPDATLIFLLCMVLVYMILCALYESVFIPFAVLLAVPCGLMGSFLFAWLFGLENNIYMQTGLIMIIGLLAKTAILLTEYAGKRRSEGMTLAQAAYSAAKVRLRPILMTVLSMVFGLIPLMLAHGVGANGSRSLATGVIGGMIVGTLALLFLVPSLFIVFQYIQERIKHN